MNSKLSIFKKIAIIAIVSLMSVNIFSCKKNKSEEPKQVLKSYDILVMNEGGYHENNASITAYNTSSSKLITDLFSTENGRGLGDVANDIIQYGNKIYVVVNLSSTLEVFSVSNGKSLKQIPLFNGKTARQPRRVCSYNGKVFICCYDGSVIRVDTASMSVEAIGKAGSNPDGICVANGKLFVSNSGGLNYPNYDSTVSVMDPISLEVLKTINVQTNPNKILSDGNNVWLISFGNYSNITASMQCINSETYAISFKEEDYSVLDYTLCGDKIYKLCYDYGTAEMICKSIKVSNPASSSVIFSSTSITSPHGIGVNPLNGDIYITDALDYKSNGDVNCFDKDGNKKFQFEAGLCPKKVLFLK